MMVARLPLRRCHAQGWRPLLLFDILALPVLLICACCAEPPPATTVAAAETTYPCLRAEYRLGGAQPAARPGQHWWDYPPTMYDSGAAASSESEWEVLWGRLTNSKAARGAPPFPLPEGTMALAIASPRASGSTIYIRRVREGNATLTVDYQLEQYPYDPRSRTIDAGETVDGLVLFYPRRDGMRIEFNKLEPLILAAQESERGPRQPSLCRGF
jgi:hypothetical protein